jgi:hypothetical protein
MRKSSRNSKEEHEIEEQQRSETKEVLEQKYCSVTT